jgi:hypothetical protein
MRTLGVWVVVAALAAWSIGACSASGDERGSGTESAGPSGAGAASAGGNGSTSVGGFDAVGGSGSGAGGEQACESLAVEAQPALQPADIIFAIDTSGSMGEESFYVRQHMNAFSQQIVASGIDVRVVMLAMAQLFPCFGIICPPGVCIDPPLGSGACPADEKPPAYYHPVSDIGSFDALTKIIDLYPSYGSVLRQDANKFLIIVTDDNAAAPNIADANTFMTQFVALDPGKLTGITVHGIYCFNNSGACVTAGTVYQDVISMTGGIHGDLALQDFQPIFNDVAAQIVLNAGELPCEYAIPAAPMGETFDKEKVNVVFTDGAMMDKNIYKVDNAAACDAQNGGWYYDDPANPTKILLCDVSCAEVSGDPMGKIDILFGCATLQPPVN